MSFYVKDEVSKDVWENAIHSFAESNFLQSWNWGLFQQQLGKTVIRLLFFDDNLKQAIGCAQLVVEDAKRGSYITIAGGPIFNWKNTELFTFIFETIKQVAKKQTVDFIRFRPQELDSVELRKLVARAGARPSQMHLTADLTLQLDLTQSEEAILAQMRKNHRSAIKKSLNQNITVEQTNNPEEIKAFYDNQVVLAQRHGFVPFSYDFLYEQFQAFASDDQVLLFHAYDDQSLLASAFVIFYNVEAVYHYGISTDANAKLPGSYACQWAAILEAKKRGCKTYNFWGIAPEGAVNHRFAGVTLFKTGFGGQAVEYLHAHDIPLSVKYSFIAVFEFIRKKMRHL